MDIRQSGSYDDLIMSSCGWYCTRVAMEPEPVELRLAPTVEECVTSALEQLEQWRRCWSRLTAQ